MHTQETDSDRVRPAEPVLLELLKAALPPGSAVDAQTRLDGCGLSSLGAARLLLRLEEELDTEVPLSLLHTAGTVRELAGRLTAGRRRARAPRPAPDPAPDSADPAAPFPLTAVQQAYLVGKFADLEPDTVGCHHYLEFSLDGAGSAAPDRLRAAWQRLVERHEMLRVRVDATGRQRVQSPAPPWTLEVQEVDPGDDFDAAARRTRDRLSHLCYQPGQWPLWTVAVTRSAGRGPQDRPPRTRAHLSVDGLLVDGVGLDVLLRDWWRCYEDPAAEPARTALGVRDCVRVLADRKAGPAHERDLAYWRERLAGMPSGPRIEREPAAQPPKEGCFRRTPYPGRLDAASWSALKEKARSWGVSPTALVLSAFCDVLGAAVGREPFALVVTTTDRLALPPGCAEAVGPFTSTAIVLAGGEEPASEASAGEGPAGEEPAGETSGGEASGGGNAAGGALSGGALAGQARALHRQLWQCLEHATVSGVEALREVRAGYGSGEDAVHLPVVFTSMLDAGAPEPAPGSFADRGVHAVSQTSGIALDHQMWEDRGALELRWDVAEDLLTEGLAGRLHQEFLATLRRSAGLVGPGNPAGRTVRGHDGAQRALGPTDRVPGAVAHPRTPVELPLNPLQQAYFVARAAGGEGAEACQIYQSLATGEALEPRRAEAAWRDMLRAHDALRGTVTGAGRLRVAVEPPADWRLPVLDLAAEPDPAGALDRLREQMCTAAPVLGGRCWDLRMTRHGERESVLHLSVDLIAADAPSILALGAELAARLCGTDAPAADPPPGVPAGRPRRPAPERRPLDTEAAARHWRRRLAGLPAGPAAPPRSRTRRRLSASLARAPLAAAAARQGTTVDAVLFAALASALADRYPPPFALPVVRWEGERPRGRHEPAERTALSWVSVPGGALDARRLARDYLRTLDEDAAADAASGLAELRVSTMRRRRTDDYAHPVVHTSLLDAAAPLPPGWRRDQWRTATPDIALDSVALDDGTTVHIGWDAAPDVFGTEGLDALFSSFLGHLPGPADEPRRLLHRWNATARDHRADAPAHRLFEEQAAARPQAVALRGRGGRTTTYGELNRRANLIAARLRDLGVGPGSVVALRLGRGPDMVAAVFGTLKAGGCYLPVDPALPAPRAHGMLADTSAAALLTDRSEHAWSAPEALPVLDVTAVTGPDAPDPGNPPALATADDLAYLIFTSGSTGRPKCVAVAHRSLLNLLDWCYRTFDFGPRDTGLCVTSLGFDLSVFDILGLLGRGASLYLADSTEQHDPELLAAVLVEERITFWNSAPTTLAHLAPALSGYTGQPGTDALRLVFLSGDYTPLPLPDAIRTVFPGARMVSLGGATEATVWSNWFPIGTVDPEWRSIPYGRPIDNARYYVLDERHEPLPAGAEGDLYIAGPCLSRGYYNRPKLTAERFLPDPFHPGSGERMYRTGDRARWTADGNLEFLGRVDGQVKIRGFRVELGEIEHRLRAHPAVRDAVVAARAEPGGDKRLVAYLIQAPGTERPGAAALRAHAAETLPDYMVPNLVAFLPRFPASANGKLDREALPWPLPGPWPGQEERGPAAPDGPRRPGPDAGQLAGDIRHFLAGLLDVPDIAPDTDLWDQGITSFSLVQLSAHLRDRYGHRVPVSALLDDPTVRGIAGSVAALLGGPHTAAAAPPPVAPEAARESRRAGRPAPSPQPEAQTQPQEQEQEQAQARPQPPREGAPEPRPEPLAKGVPEPPEFDFFSEEARAGLKAARLHLRPRRARDPVLALPDLRPEAGQHRARATRREFGTGPVPAKALARLLALLRPVDDSSGRYLYPSAGDTRAVQVYLDLRPGAVEGCPEGVYYYNPEEHLLQRVAASGAGTGRRAHLGYNRPVHDRAAFEILLIGRTAAVAPLYERHAERFLALEAGCVAQLLMAAQPDTGIGLCPVGALAFEPVRERLGLAADDCFLLSFLAGPLDGTDAAGMTGAADFTSAADRTDAAHITAAATAATSAGAATSAAIAASAATSAAFAASAAGSSATTASAVAAEAVGTPVTGHRAALARPRAAGEPRPAGPAACAVVGLSAQLPGAADPESLWRSLSSGRSLLGPPPPARAEALAAARAPGRRRPFPVGGYLTDPEAFDGELFRISPREAAGLDPQVKLALRVAWECLESAGHTPATLRRDGRRVGVFAAAMWHDHRQTGADRYRAGGPAELAAPGADLAARISHCFDFRGPSLAVDTSCASSLTAVHLAVQSLRAGDCDSALVVGVNLLGHPYHLDLLGDLGLLADPPGAGAYDGAGTGWTPGEGAGAVLLRPVPAARADGDLVHGVVEASAVGQAGRAERFGAPRAAALAESLAALLRHAGLEPADIDYAECAAAGAGLADAAELDALTAALGAERTPDDPLLIGTVKPNVGHLEGAAGISQLAKVLLQLRHRAIAPTLLARTPSPLVTGNGSGVRVADTLRRWPDRGGAPRALVNALGANGGFAHLVVRGDTGERRDGGAAMTGERR